MYKNCGVLVLANCFCLMVDWEKQDFVLIEGFFGGMCDVFLFSMQLRVVVIEYI